MRATKISLFLSLSLFPSLLHSQHQYLRLVRWTLFVIIANGHAVSLSSEMFVARVRFAKPFEFFTLTLNHATHRAADRRDTSSGRAMVCFTYAQLFSYESREDDKAEPNPTEDGRRKRAMIALHRPSFKDKKKRTHVALNMRHDARHSERN